MKIPFTKMTGAGNDFVVIDNRKDLFTDKAGLARTLCDRHWGVGADGLLLLENGRGSVYRMEYYNADGSHGGMCGNGGRCMAAFAVELGVAPAEHTFEALGYGYSAHVKGETVSLRMKDPRDIRLNIVLPIGSDGRTVHFVDTGAPHVVIPAEDVDAMNEVSTLGRAIRMHEAFKPNGTNVNFVQKTGPKSLRIRTYERGVEAETLACGTGSVAAAVIGSLVFGMSSPVSVQVRSGSILSVRFESDPGKEIRDVELSGPVKSVFKGEIDV